MATSLVFATLFFVGAAVAAGAGDAIVEAMESDTAAACDAASADAETAACPDASAEAPGDGTPGDVADDPAEEPTETETESAPEDGADESSAGTEASADEATTGTTDEADGGAREPADDGQKQDGSAGGSATDASPNDGSSNAAPNDGAAADKGKAADPPVVARQPAAHAKETTKLDPEAEAFTFATVWLHRELPDPIRPTERLAPAFARQLRAESKRAHVDWALVLAALRAEGERGRTPASRHELRSLAHELHGLLKGQEEWQALLALHGRTAFADRAMALTRYNRAAGLRPLLTGFEASKEQIADRVLSDRRLDIYGAGRGDIAAGRINVRVLVLMRYMAEAYGQVTVSSLETGHGLYARPGVVSAHIYGLAVDIAALGGKSITGNSERGGLTEQAVRDILMLPTELRPRQVISLLGLGGPSFPLANHYDHIHVGF